MEELKSVPVFLPCSVQVLEPTWKWTFLIPRREELYEGGQNLAKVEITYFLVEP